jgi:DNA primase
VAGFISEEQIEEVRRANDIVEVIREFVPLKRAGKDFKALCPFHNEKTPSFQVSPSKQIFKCFGCGKGGNVFGFVMSVEHLEFPEAVEFLARRAGVTLARRSGESRESASRRESLFEINLWAAKVFYRCLLNPEMGRPGRDYLATRGLDESTWTKFKLGFAPESWDFLLGLCGSKGFSTGDLAAAGLALERQGGTGYYDRFRHRIMFPILDVRGRVIAFGGRALDDSLPKYLNSPETSLFSKGTCLYGLDAAKDGMLREKRVIVVEGYTDCLMSHQHGVDWTVATLGTALTPSHVSTLRRYVDEVLLVFDGDNAGRAAAERSIDIFLEQDVDMRVVLLPEELDPCDFLVKHGKEEFLKVVGGARDVFDLKMEIVAARNDLTRTAGKMAAIDEMLTILAKAANSLRRDMLLTQNEILKRLCREMGVTEAALRDRLQAIVRPRRRASVGGPVRTTPRGSSAERELLGTVLADGSLTEKFRTEVKPEHFGDADVRRVAEAALAAAAKKDAIELNDVLDRLGGDDAAQLAVDLYEESCAKGSEKDRFEAALAVLEKERRRAAMEEIRRQLAEARASGDEAKEIELLGRYQELAK